MPIRSIILLLIICVGLLNQISAMSHKQTPPVVLYFNQEDSISGVKIYKIKDDYEINTFNYQVSQNIQQRIFFRDKPGALLVTDRDILKVTKLGAERLFSQKNFDENDHFWSRVSISGMSNNEEKIILFLDRRASHHDYDLSLNQFEVPILYPDQDAVSGFYVLDIETKEYRKLDAMSNFVAWIDNGTLLINNQNPSVFAKSPPIKYQIYDLFSNKATKTINLKTLSHVWFPEHNSSNRVIGRGYSESHQLSWVEFDKKALCFQLIKSNVTPESTNGFKCFAYHSQIVSVTSIQTMDNASQEQVDTKIYIDGELKISLFLDQILDYDWISTNQIVLLSKNTVYIFDTDLLKILRTIEISK